MTGDFLSSSQRSKWRKFHQEWYNWWWNL